MAIRKARGAVRSTGRVHAKRLVLTPPKSRKGLLGGTALANGSLAGFASNLARPDRRVRWLSTGGALAATILGGITLFPASGALAACDPGPTNTWTCETAGSETGGVAQLEAQPTGDFTINIGSTESDDIYTNTSGVVNITPGAPGGAIVIINDQFNGTVSMTAGSILTSTKTDGIRFYDTGNNGVGPDVTFDLQGKIYGGSQAYKDGSTKTYGDGFHVGKPGVNNPGVESKIGSISVTVGSTVNDDATIQGADDGIFIGQRITTKATVTNYGTVIGHGRYDNTQNYGMGVNITNVNQRADNGTGPGFQIEGAAEVNNYGIIEGHTNVGSPAFTSTPGFGVNVAALGAIDITNGKFNSDHDSSITGTTGIYAYGGGDNDISVTNYGHIGGFAGVGVQIANGDVGTITNHSLQSIIGEGGIAGVVATGLDQVIFNNEGGLTAGLTSDGAYIADISGIGHENEDAVSVYNNDGGVIAGLNNGLVIHNVFGDSDSESGDANSVVVQNGGFFDSEDWHAGGLIVGVSESGVLITGVRSEGGDGSISGNVYIGNDYTRRSSVNLGDLDPLVYDFTSEGGSTGLLAAFGEGGTPDLTTGIYGYTDGVHVADVGGNVTVSNQYGLIYGETGDGIDVSKVDGAFRVYNYAPDGGEGGGIVIGGIDGIRGDTIGQAHIENDAGQIAGLTGDGVYIANVSGADGEGEDGVFLSNRDGGLIAGLNNGVVIDNVFGDSEGGAANNVYVQNSGYFAGPFGEGDFHGGGLIVGVQQDGVHITNVVASEGGGISGNVTIDNDFTLASFFGGSGPFGGGYGVDLNQLDPLIYDYDSEGGGSSGLLSNYDGNVFGPSEGQAAGIFGYVNGVTVAGVGGNATVSNQFGFIYGETGDGISASDIAGNFTVHNETPEGDFLPGGFIVGNVDGIRAANIGGNVDISNQAGFILGESGVGIDVSESGGSFTVRNNAPGDFGGGQIFGQVAGIRSDRTGSVYIYNDYGLVVGDSEGGYGIALSNVTGSALVKNDRGSIFADGESGTGVFMNHVSGGATIVNGYWQTDAGDVDNYGFIAGSDGVVLNDVAGIIDFNNTRGITYGDGTALTISEAGGDIDIHNSGGMFEGYLGDGITIAGDFNNDVYISNGYDHGGVILGGKDGSAIAATDIRHIEIVNGYSWQSNEGDDGKAVQGGLIAGAGTEAHPVITLNTDDGTEGGAEIYNHGIIGALGQNAYSHTTRDNVDYVSSVSEGYDPHLPGLTLPLEPDEAADDLDLLQIYVDAGNIGRFVTSDGVSGSLGNLSDYGVAANDLAIVGRGGRVYVENEDLFDNPNLAVNQNVSEGGLGGIIFGRVDLTGVNEDGEGDFTVGNEIWNRGAWFTVGVNTLDGDGHDMIRNDGLIQTAFDGESGEATTFVVDTFKNDQPSYQGFLSMLDGGADDTNTITGNFIGSEGDGNSYLAVDAFLDAEGGSGMADKLFVNGTARGSTGIIVNVVDNSPSGYNQEGILVVSVDDGEEAGCTSGYGSLCQEGDTFFVSDRSRNYVSINGIGAVQQGLYAWAIRADDNEGRDYVLVSDRAPAADQLGELPGAGTNMFYGAGEMVNEHIDGGRLLNNGSGGAEVAGDTSATNAAIWGRASGRWTTRDTSVDSSMFGTIDTSFQQNIYTLLGGVDMSTSPDGDGTRFGVYGGYATSRASFTGYDTSAKFTGGVVGGYVALNKDNFYVDTQVTAEFLNMDFHAPFGTGTDGTTDGTTIGVIANIGDRFYSGDNFIEPIVSVTYAKTEFDDMTAGGAQVTFTNGESLRGGVGARLGTIVKTPTSTTEFSFLAKVWNEFSGDNVVTITDGSDTDTDTYTASTGGVFGEFSGSATVYNADRSLSSFISGGAEVKSDSTTWNAKVGIRKGF